MTTTTVVVAVVSSRSSPSGTAGAAGDFWHPCRPCGSSRRLGSTNVLGLAAATHWTSLALEDEQQTALGHGLTLRVQCPAKRPRGSPQRRLTLQGVQRRGERGKERERERQREEVSAVTPKTSPIRALRLADARRTRRSRRTRLCRCRLSTSPSPGFAAGGPGWPPGVSAGSRGAEGKG